MTGRRAYFFGLLAGAVFIAGGIALAERPEPKKDVPWTVKPDPLPPTTAPAATSTDFAPIKSNLSMVMLTRGRREVLVPSRPSRYLMTHGEDGWELWDLSAGTRPFNGPQRFEFENLAISPDGKYIAGTQRGRPPHFVEVYSVKDKKMLIRVDSTDDDVPPTTVGFVGSNRILVRHLNPGRMNNFGVYDLASGQETAEFSSTGEKTRLSPTGAYAVVESERRLSFYSTSTGLLCGQVSADEGDEERQSGAQWLSYTSMDFSPDGQEVALLFQDRSHSRIVTYGLTDGQKKLDFRFALSNMDINERRQPFSYLPDNSGWLLLGDVVVDRASKLPVYRLGHDNAEVLYARMGSADQLFQIIKGDQRIIFRTLPVTKEMVARGVDAVEAGGRPEDAELPPVTTPDISSAAANDFASAPVEPWQVTLPDSAATVWQPIDHFAFKAPPRAEGGGRIVIEPSALVCTSFKGRGLLLEMSYRGESPDGFHPAVRTGGCVQRYELASGSLQTEVKTSAVLNLLDASPSGDVLLFRGGSGQDRIDLMARNQATYKPLVSMRPYEFEGKESAHRITWAGMLDETHLLTAGGKGTLIMWEVPACKAIWRGKEGQAERVALSPDRSMGVVTTENGLVVFDTASGKAINSLQETAHVQVSQIGFSPDGRQLGAVIRDGQTPYTLDVFDLTTGKTITSVMLPNSPDRVEAVKFPAKGYAMVGDYLIHLGKQCILWKYEINRWSGIAQGPVMPYYGLWAITGGDGKPPFLTHVSVPHEAALKQVAKLDPLVQYVWAPPMKLSLNLTVVGDEKYRQQELASWTQQLQAMGYVVADNQPNILTASTKVLASPSEMYKIQGTEESVSIANYELGWSISLSVGGQVVWKNEKTTVPRGMMMPSVFITRNKGESAQQAADRMYGPPAQGSKIILPPLCILDTVKIGFSDLGLKGWNDYKPVGEAARVENIQPADPSTDPPPNVPPRLPIRRRVPPPVSP